MIFSIQEMPSAVPDYHRYVPRGPDIRRWGIGITGAGIAKIAVGAAGMIVKR